MKNGIVKSMAMIFIMVVSCVMQSYGQSSKKEVGLGKAQASILEVQEKVKNPKASEVLGKIVDDIVTKKTPIQLYPPGLADWLLEMGDEPMQFARFEPGTSALTAGDIGNMVWINPGTFIMGSPTNEGGRKVIDSKDEIQHQVIITSGFYIGKYEVTQGEFLEIMGVNPSFHVETNGYPFDLNRPVEVVSWNDSTNFCSILTQRELSAGRIQSGWQYRLPTEAEWEYVCRAGTTNVFNFGSYYSKSIHGFVASFDTRWEYWPTQSMVYVSNAPIQTVFYPITVGNYEPNPWGVYDMHGNVAEWCQDYINQYSTNGISIDPLGTNSSSFRVIRGGASYNTPEDCRSSQRFLNYPGSQIVSGFRVVLAPVVPLWKTAITNQPPQPTYSPGPVKGSGKDSLVLVTHGWNLFPLPVDIGFVDSMSNSISSYLINHSLTNWQVYGYVWTNNSWKLNVQDALNSGKQEGKNLGNIIGSQSWNHIHLIAYSAGAGLIQSATERIKAISPSTTVHCTFLDPFVSLDYSEVSKYGKGADWSDNYFSHDVTGSYTEQNLEHAYNVNVTQLGEKKTVFRFQPLSIGHITPCVETIESHRWSVNFYTNTITGNTITGNTITGNTNSDYMGFGFPLSKEGGNWNYATNHYFVGNTNAHVLGTNDPPCGLSDSEIIPPVWLTKVVNFVESPFIKSTTGFVQQETNSIRLTNGSPVWLATVVSSTNPVNTVSFGAQFTSTNGAQGLLTVYWDDQVIGSIDERVSPTNSYKFRFQNTIANSSHILGFRLDPFTNIQSSLFITNVVLSQIGVSQPFSLSVVTNSSDGMVYKFTGESGFKYPIQASTNLVDWVDVAVLLNTNGVVHFFDPTATNRPVSFYRAITPY